MAVTRPPPKVDANGGQVILKGTVRSSAELEEAERVLGRRGR